MAGFTAGSIDASLDFMVKPSAPSGAVAKDSLVRDLQSAKDNDAAFFRIAIHPQNIGLEDQGKGAVHCLPWSGEFGPGTKHLAGV